MERIGGVDVARGVAVLGMMSAHVGVAGPDLWSTDGWLGVADGRSAALFGVLAGLSIALLSGGPRPVSGSALGRARVRIAVRGGLLLLLGMFLAALGAPIAIILQSYGLLFALALPVLRLPRTSLALLAVAVALGGPGLCFALTDTLTSAGRPPTGLLELLVAGYYPAAVWLAYVLAGLALGRSDLRSTALRVRLGLLGAGLAVAGYGGGVLLTAMAAGQSAQVLRLLSVEPHADSTFEVAGNTGVAFVVIAVSLVVADRWPRVVYPLAATGALALTAYSTHIVAIAVMGDEVVREPQVTVHLGFLVTTLVLTSLWRAVLGRGPLERAMHVVSTSVAASVVDRDESPAGGSGSIGPQGQVGPQGQTSSRLQPADVEPAESPAPTAPPPGAPRR
ncbi:heparan-alpha-glucosaminide N-acetyltransferase domain-containing protein [Cellulomonas aerilata]|uniref:Heparan-alpha-glucosaminide N-acetyltransferase catalytic domain-containing protein n=1 Tax=Cellulomonas aerilata TaxID=515326 RepID=A0A512DGX9_9CELL|nr:heparan-alpha-glucosaminide N-acetyltransferase domain-containing protein [Cellulomonas aerilata]GEO35738.1 hypothetical protein CAE01nite_34630 [Cellulomonas aerilata]